MDNRAALVAEILSESHRPDLEDDVTGFIRRAEGMIAREVRALEQVVTVTLTDADRVVLGEPVYMMPANFLDARVIWAPWADGCTREVTQKSLAEIRRIPLTSSIWWYAVRGSRIEFRGNPAENAEIEVDYFARLASMTADADTNDLLVAHEELYLAGALFYLHRHTQDLELAQAALDSFGHARDTLNEQAAHRIGGASIAPSGYNFSSRGSY